MDKRIKTPTEIQNVRNCYQDVNKNKVKYLGKILVDVEYENNKQNWKY